MNNFYSSLFLSHLMFLRVLFLVLLFLFFIYLYSHKLFHHFSTRVNFILMTLTSSLHFLNKNYLLLSLEFLLVLVKLSFGVILCSSNSIPRNLILSILANFLDLLIFFPQSIFHLTFHSPLLSPFIV